MKGKNVMTNVMDQCDAFLYSSKLNVSYFLNPFLANVSILYPLKTPENLWFSGVFRGYKMGTLARNGLRALKFYSLSCDYKLNLC